MQVAEGDPVGAFVEQGAATATGSLTVGEITTILTFDSSLPPRFEIIW